ncbi:hypothetical protein B0O99DRAFT_347747 [Bisporella sp. PMI_857]|nr:hypothetical protein B0O99DRAFT_347747 [Bisporella sp. PMI_857]
MIIRDSTIRSGILVSFLLSTDLTCQAQLSAFSQVRSHHIITVMSPSFHNEHGAKAIVDVLNNYSVAPQADSGNGSKHLQNAQWHIPAGTYTPRQIVQSCSPLLEAVLYHLGPDRPGEPARELLLGNLASNLRIDTRESTLRLPDVAGDAGRKEIANQAIKIGKTIVQYAREVKHPEFDKSLDIRSPCEGHLLNHAVVGLIFGPRSQRHLMQLYNEYLHQMVLLRDALLPFENYEEVIIPLSGKTGRNLGLRGTQQSRTAFIGELMTRSISQNSVFQVARSLLAPKLSSNGGYAFQYTHGSVLPALVAGGNSFRLLRYLPFKLDKTASEVLFDYEHEDYFSAPKSEIASEVSIQSPQSWSQEALRDLSSAELSSYSLAAEKSRDPERASISLLQLRLEFDNGVCAAVDLGQIARGKRYAYTASSSPGLQPSRTSSSLGFSVPSYLHSPIDILTKSGSGLAVSKRAGIHLIPTRDSIVKLALLGKIYPENTVILNPGQNPQVVEETGKSFSDSAKFVIYDQN